MPTWKPITRAEFKELYEKQYSELGVQERELFDQHRIEPQPLIIRRWYPKGQYHEGTSHKGEFRDGIVYGVWKKEYCVLYFDDVEWGFNYSSMSPDGRILHPGGEQSDLQDAIRLWL